MQVVSMLSEGLGSDEIADQEFYRLILNWVPGAAPLGIRFSNSVSMANCLSRITLRTSLKRNRSSSMRARN